MTIPVTLLTIAVWCALLGVGAGAIVLIVLVVRDWSQKKLW